jgi:antirestriction protein ArdC
MFEFRLETEDSIQNSNSYLIGWLKALEDDHRMIVKAASRAEKAVRYIFNGPENIRPSADWKGTVAPALMPAGSLDDVPFEV